jgi:SAM-dependent methyltransferase
MKAASLWNNEYLSIRGIPTSDKTKTGLSHTKYFLNYLHANNIYDGNLLDIGCGLGFDAIFFAKNGFKTTGVDISKIAIGKAKNNGACRNKEGLDFKILDIRENWEFADNKFIAAYDGTTFINLTTDKEIMHYFHELKRVLVKGGMYQIVLPILPDEYYKKLVDECTSKQVVNKSGLVQKAYEKEEIISLVEDHITIEKVELMSKRNYMYGELYKRTLLRIIAKNETK